MQIVSIVKDSFIESAPFNWGLTLFCFGCNLQCSFCKGYNYESVTNKNNIIGDAISILEKEVKPCHDCVIFIGGEPTIWGNKLLEALEWCHRREKKTKIFSNGLKSDLIREINKKKLCDSWSIDLKGTKENVGEYIGISGELYYNNLKESLRNIIENNLPLEIRTTYFKGNIKDQEAIREEIKLIEKYMKESNFNNYYKYFEQQDFRENNLERNILSN